MSDKQRTLTDAELDDVLARLPEIREREQAATKGPFDVVRIKHAKDDPLFAGTAKLKVICYLGMVLSKDGGHDRLFVCATSATEAECCFMEENADLFAHARRDIPDLLAAVETLREQRDALARNMKTLEDAYYQQVRELAELRAKQEPSDA